MLTRTVTAVAAVVGVGLIVAGSGSDAFAGLRGGETPVAFSSAAPAALVSATHSTDEAIDPAVLTQVVARTCVMCHNDAMLTGGLSLQGFDVAKADANPEKAEK